MLRNVEELRGYSIASRPARAEGSTPANAQPRAAKTL